MSSVPRYEIVETIASGDFATVSRARDRELGREVAIKQIHQHFLTDQRQLARYWQEAQLLASLQHPNILTIYDLVRPRGWLILELMRGSMKQVAQGEPIDLDFLRLALACTLNALHFLHTNGIVHGDVKPSNLLIDQQNRVKLGDFGLARRAASDQGSLLKGTTKYMAPELLSNQFGAVGPASDLYSLGFTAYELMCGAQFDALFPSLSSFGRDQQIAWMMWHAAPDRHLPEVGRVLQGVPDDLARVIQRMATKDQARRYHSALDALRDLHTERMTAGMLNEPLLDDVAQTARRRRRRRLAAIGGTFLASLLAVVAMLLFMPQPKKKLPPPPAPNRGIVRDVLPDEQRLIVESEESGVREPLALRNKDRIFINGKETRVFADLKQGDEIVKVEHRDAAKGRWIELKASRPEHHVGRIAEIKPDEGRFTLSVTEGEDQGKTREIAVATSLKILLNGDSQIAKKVKQLGEEKMVKQPVTLADLHVDDRVTVGDVGEDMGLRASELSAQRIVSFEGVIRNIEAAKHQFTLSLGEGDNAETVTLPWAPKCDVTLNDRSFIDQQMLKPTDLKVGDKAKVHHDVQITRIDAYRVLGFAGTIQTVDYAARQLVVVREENKQRTFHAGPACTVTLGGESAAVDDLRGGDTVELKLDRADVELPEATSVAARRPADPARWAILIGNQHYGDSALTRPTTPAGDVKLLADALVKRYRVPQEQTLVLIDEPLVRLQQAVRDLLAHVPAEGNLVVYLGGNAYKDEERKTVYYAPKDFKLREAATTGLALQSLLDQLEACPAKEKLWLLDCTQAGTEPDLQREPSAAEMLEGLKGPPGYKALRTVFAEAGCLPGQRQGVLPTNGHSLFAWCLAQGYSGRADKERSNGTIRPEALDSYLHDAMPSAAAAAKLAAVPTPKLFLPDPRAPRLSADAKKAIGKLAALLRQERPAGKAAAENFEKQVAEDYEAAATAAGKEIEPRLLFALLLLKVKKTDEVFKVSQEIGGDHAELLLPVQLMAWVQFERHHFQSGSDELLRLITKIQPSKDPAGLYPGLTRRIFSWAGQLREFAAMVPANQRPPSADALQGLDAAIAERGVEAMRAYEQGRAQTRKIAADYDNRVAQAEADSDKPAAAKFNVERRQLANYVVYPFDDGAQAVLDSVER